MGVSMLQRHEQRFSKNKSSAIVLLEIISIVILISSLFSLVKNRAYVNDFQSVVEWVYNTYLISNIENLAEELEEKLGPEYYKCEDTDRIPDMVANIGCLDYLEERNEVTESCRSNLTCGIWNGKDIRKKKHEKGE